MGKADSRSVVMKLVLVHLAMMALLRQHVTIE